MPYLATGGLPAEALELLSTCSVVVLASATPDDTEFLLSTIGSLPAKCRTILQLSMAQLNDKQNAARLMSAVDVVLMNEAEACARGERCVFD